jgi:hypothetical protein
MSAAERYCGARLPVSVAELDNRFTFLVDDERNARSAIDIGEG